MNHLKGMSHPDHYYHYVYVNRCDRWIVLYEYVLLTVAVYLYGMPWITIHGRQPIPPGWDLFWAIVLTGVTPFAVVLILYAGSAILDSLLDDLRAFKRWLGGA